MQYRDQVWPYASIWGEIARKVREHLISTYNTDGNPNSSSTDATTLENARREKDLVLQVSISGTFLGHLTIPVSSGGGLKNITSMSL